MINGKLFFALAAQKLGSDKALPFLALDASLGTGARTVMSIKMIEEAETQAAATALAQTRATTAEAKSLEQQKALTAAVTERDTAIRDQDTLRAKVGAAEELASTAQNETAQLRLDKEKLADDIAALQSNVTEKANRIATLESDVTDKSNRIATLEQQLSDEAGATEKVSGEVTTLRDKLVQAETKMTALTGELEEVRTRHAKLQSEFTVQDRAFAALAHQFAGPDATDAEKAALENRLMTTFARVPDEGPEALTDLMVEFMMDRREDSPFTQMEAKLNAHPALKKKVQATLHAMEKEHLDRLKAFHTEIETELAALDTPKKPRATRKKKS